MDHNSSSRVLCRDNITSELTEISNLHWKMSAQVELPVGFDYFCD